MTRGPRWQPFVAIGFASVVLIGATGVAVEGWKFGWSETATFQRIERDVRERIDRMIASLRAASATVAGDAELVSAARDDEFALRTLFERVEAAADGDVPPELSITVYGVSGTPMAWAGRPSELPAQRLSGPEAIFIAPGTGGLRLVLVRPIPASQPPPGGGSLPRVATLAAELPLSTRGRSRGMPSADDFVLDVGLAPVTLRTRYEGAGDRPLAAGFLIAAPDGAPLLEAAVSPADVAAARSRWRGRFVSLTVTALGLTVLLLLAPVAAGLERTETTARAGRRSLMLVALALATGGLVWLANPAMWWLDPTDVMGYTAPDLRPVVRSSFDLLLLAVVTAGSMAIWLDAHERRRRRTRRERRAPARQPVSFVVEQVTAGLVLAALVASVSLGTRAAIDGATVDPTQFSIQPWNPRRLALALGLIIGNAAVLWAGVGACLVATRRWRVPSLPAPVAVSALTLWLAPVVAVAALAPVADVSLPTRGVLLSGAACGLVAISRRPLTAWYRHASQGARLLAFSLVILGPAWLLLPTAVHVGDRAKRELVETQLTPQTMQHDERLQRNLYSALEQIDEFQSLADAVAGLEDPPNGAPPTNTAFLVWRNTDLARFRVTSAIDIYGRSGEVVSGFSMNFAEFAQLTPGVAEASCSWRVSVEAPPLAYEEQRLFHAERAVCEADGSIVGALVVQAMLDYGTLPFISSQSPYFELFRDESRPLADSAQTRDIELVIYGWGWTPIYRSGDAAWTLDAPLVERLGASREPFWTRLSRGGTEYDVYFANDRSGIYALGYPVAGWLERAVQLAELATLAAIAYLAYLLVASALNEIARRGQHSGRALLREVRQSFYRKLFLAFVATSVVPLLILAVVMRGYFANRLRIDVEGEAARTAALAQGVIEESLAFQRRAQDATPLTDDTMVVIGKMIEQDVNVFAGPTLTATSERDLFASGLLPTRTPHQVYRAIELERQPRFVGEDAIGGVRYMLAAAPVRLDGRDAILTVPQTLRQQEIERQIDELDRRVYLAAMLFSLLGAAIGFYMAERIADPVNRLTRATSRIARGDFDAAVAIRSADELERLVASFNQMASDLKAQQDQLQRTHRLEAWAEMARQVAHEIKNPLTPIQLSAEHLRRVHADSNAPMGRVFDSCVDSILKQVHLLRQIAAEFSSFASSPQVHATPVDLAGLIREVVEPYRPGIAESITIQVDVPDGVPNVLIDRTLVSRALTNLIENALHAMTGPGTLTVRAHHLDGTVEVRVSDTGRGMDAEAVDRAFEPYFSTKATGTGLGLTIAKRNVELSGGSIALTSGKGEGTTVTLKLPAGAPHASGASRGAGARDA